MVLCAVDLDAVGGVELVTCAHVADHLGLWVGLKEGGEDEGTEKSSDTCQEENVFAFSFNRKSKHG